MHPITATSARRVAAVVAGLALAASQALAASAHTVKTAGPYSLEIGWHVEPTYVGQPNAVEVTITDAQDKAVTDLGPEDLHAVVSTAGQDSPSLSFDPAFDLAEADGTPGQYIAKIEPTAPGDYAFHITGTIHGQAVDVSVMSGDQTFDPAVDPSDIEFPAKLPTMAEVSTHLDRIDQRIAEGGSAQDQAAISDAQAAADRALWVGGGIGVVGIVIAALALVVAARSRSAGRAAG